MCIMNKVNKLNSNLICNNNIRIKSLSNLDIYLHKRLLIAWFRLADKLTF